MRDAKRLISPIAVHLPLHATEHTVEVNLIGFFGAETIRVFEPDLYDALFRKRDLVLQSLCFEATGGKTRPEGRRTAHGNRARRDSRPVPRRVEGALSDAAMGVREDDLWKRSAEELACAKADLHLEVLSTLLPSFRPSVERAWRASGSCYAAPKIAGPGD